MAPPYNNSSMYGAGMSGMAFARQSRNLNPYAENFNYNNSPVGNRLTEGGLGQILMLALGGKLNPIPQPNSTQGIYDAFWQRQKDVEMVQIRNAVLADNPIWQRLGGINQGSMLFQYGAAAFGGPDGALMKIMSPMLGGNPIKAAMGTYANMRGLNMASFGRSGENIGADEIGQMMKAYYNYNWDKKQVTPEQIKNSIELVQKRSKINDIVQNLGLPVSYDTSGLTPEKKREVDAVLNADKTQLPGLQKRMEEQVTDAQQILSNALVALVTPGEANPTFNFKKVTPKQIEVQKKRLADIKKDKQVIADLDEETWEPDDITTPELKQITSEEGVTIPRLTKEVDKLEKSVETELNIITRRKENQDKIEQQEKKLIEFKEDREIAQKLGVTTDGTTNWDTKGIKSKDRRDKADEAIKLAQKGDNLAIDNLQTTYNKEQQAIEASLKKTTNQKIKQDNVDQANAEVEKLISNAKIIANLGKDHTDVSEITDDTTKKEASKALTDALTGNTTKLNELKEKVQNATVESEKTRDTLIKNRIEGTGIPGSINFEKTRGFQQEDLFSAFYTAGANNLISGRQKGVVGSFEEFQKKSVGTLDAFRGFYGNDKTGKELMGLVNNFLGVSNVDMNDEAQMNGLEQQVRGIKSLARILNVSVPQTLEMVDQIKSVAANTPGLQHIGGIEAMSMVSKALPQTAAIMSTMSNKSIRRAGGSEGILQQVIAGEIESQTQPISQQLAAAYTYFTGNKEMQDKIVEYATGGGSKSIQGYQTFLNGLGDNMPGFNKAQFRNYINYNKVAADQGLSAMPVLGTVGKEALIQTQRTKLFYSNGPKGQEELNAFDRIMATETIDIDKYFADVENKNDVAEGIKKQYTNFAKYKASDEFNNPTTNEQKARKKFVVDKEEELNKLVLTTYDVAGGKIYDAEQNPEAQKLKKYLSPQELDLQKLISAKGINSPELYDLTKNMIDHGLISNIQRKRSPSFDNLVKSIEVKKEKEVVLDTQMSKELAQLNAPATQVLAQQFLKGELKAGGIWSLLSPYLTKDKNNEEKEVFAKEVMNINDLKASPDLKELAKGMNRASAFITDKKEGEEKNTFTSEKLDSLSRIATTNKLTGAELEAVYNTATGKKADEKLLNALNRDRKGKQIDEKDIPKIREAATTARLMGIDSTYTNDFEVKDLSSQATKHYGQQLLEKNTKAYIDVIDSKLKDTLTNINKGVYTDATGKEARDPKFKGEGDSDTTEQKRDRKLAGEIRDVKTEDISDLLKTNLTEGQPVPKKFERFFQYIPDINTLNPQQKVESVQKLLKNLGLEDYVKRADAVKTAAEAGTTEKTLLVQILDFLKNIPTSIDGIAKNISTLTTMLGGS